MTATLRAVLLRVSVALRVKDFCSLFSPCLGVNESSVSTSNSFFYPDLPTNLIAEGKFRKANVMVCFTDDDGGTLIQKAPGKNSLLNENAHSKNVNTARAFIEILMDALVPLSDPRRFCSQQPRKRIVFLFLRWLRSNVEK